MCLAEKNLKMLKKLLLVVADPICETFYYGFQDERLPKRLSLNVSPPGAEGMGNLRRSVSKKKVAERKSLIALPMDVLSLLKHGNSPMPQFLDKKRSGYELDYIYMTAGVNKFLRVYYGRAWKYLT